MLGASSFLERWLWQRSILDCKSPQRVNVPVLVIALFHLLALLACVPWLSGVSLGLAPRPG
jgi:hypothetical protein